ncbi:MAG: hypothetical protein DME50_18235, partial [Verrucomicrobia bacterium]
MSSTRWPDECGCAASLLAPPANLWPSSSEKPIHRFPPNHETVPGPQISAAKLAITEYEYAQAGIIMRNLRSAFLLVQSLLAISTIPLAQGQPQHSRKSQTNSETSRNSIHSANGTKTIVRVHDTAERSQIASPQQTYSVPGRLPSGTICGVESRAAHGQVAPNTNGGTLNPLAFANPTTVNASGRVAFNSQVDGSDRNQGVFVADSDGTISAIAIGCGGLGGGGDTTSMCGDASPIGGHFGGFFSENTVFTPDINDAGDVLFFCDV